MGDETKDHGMLDKAKDSASELAGKAAGTAIVLKDYVRFQLGEGIEKEESDFAAEVAAAVGG
jgi:translation elongation factor EF-Ts